MLAKSTKCGQPDASTYSHMRRTSIKCLCSSSIKFHTREIIANNYIIGSQQILVVSLWGS